MSRDLQCGTDRSGLSTPMTVLISATAITVAALSAYIWIPRSASSDGADAALLAPVKRGDFVLTITERGEVESAGDIEVKSEVKSAGSQGIAILRIVPEGTKVEEADFLVQLDSSVLDSELTTQQIVVNTAEAALVEARNVYETALIARREYLDGTFVQERQTIESEIFVAEENLSRAQEYLKYSRKLAERGYVNEIQLEADQFALEKSRKELDAAKTKLRVLEDYTKTKMLKDLDSAIVIGKAKWGAQQKSYDLELKNLREIEDQVAKTTIRAPRAGVVKYAHEHDRRGDSDFIVEEGAVVRERQTIIRLPDTSQMEVEVSINESFIQFVEPGLAAAVTPVGLDGAVVQGKVARVNTYAEPSGWRRANVKEYKAYVSIDSPPPGLRSGMTASVTIRSLFVPNALQVPVQAVYAHGGKMYCFVRQGGGLKAQEIQCGPTNDKFFVVEQGLEDSDQVALNPRNLVEYVDLPAAPPERKQQAVALGEAPKAPERTEAPVTQPGEGRSEGLALEAVPESGATAELNARNSSSEQSAASADAAP